MKYKTSETTDDTQDLILTQKIKDLKNADFKSFNELVAIALKEYFLNTANKKGWPDNGYRY